MLEVTRQQKAELIDRLNHIAELDESLNDMVKYSDEYEETYWDMYGEFESTSGDVDEVYDGLFGRVFDGFLARKDQCYTMRDLITAVIAEMEVSENA